MLYIPEFETFPDDPQILSETFDRVKDFYKKLKKKLYSIHKEETLKFFSMINKKDITENFLFNQDEIIELTKCDTDKIYGSAKFYNIINYFHKNPKKSLNLNIPKIINDIRNIFFLDYLENEKEDTQEFRKQTQDIVYMIFPLRLEKLSDFIISLSPSFSYKDTNINVNVLNDKLSFILVQGKEISYVYGDRSNYPWYLTDNGAYHRVDNFLYKYTMDGVISSRTDRTFIKCKEKPGKSAGNYLSSIRSFLLNNMISMPYLNKINYMASEILIYDFKIPLTINCKITGRSGILEIDGDFVQGDFIIKHNSIVDKYKNFRIISSENVLCEQICKKLKCSVDEILDKLDSIVESKEEPNVLREEVFKNFLEKELNNIK